MGFSFMQNIIDCCVGNLVDVDQHFVESSSEGPSGHQLSGMFI